MKKWNTPAIAELSLEATESGWKAFYFETCLLVNDSLKKCPNTPQDVPTPVTPDDNDTVEVIDQNS